MPSCFKCSADNPAGTKYCVSCGALLPQIAPTGASSSSIDLDEETQYLAPTKHYPSEELLQLAWCANDFLEEEVQELDGFLDAYEHVKQKFENYKSNNMTAFLDLVADDRARAPEDPYPKQLAYLHNKGVGLYEEGIAIVEGFLDAYDADKIEAEQLKEGVIKLVLANDHFSLAFELVQARIGIISSTLEECGYTVNEHGEAVRTRPDLDPDDDEPGPSEESTSE